MINKFLADDTKNKINNNIKSNLELLLKKYKNEAIDKSEYPDILFFCSVFLKSKHFTAYKKQIEDIVISIVSSLRDDVYNGVFYPFRGMFSELGLVAYSFNLLELDNFKNYFNDILYKNTINFVNSIADSKVMISHYDMIYGIAGILNYFLNGERYNDFNLDFMIKYLLELSSNKPYGNKEIIKFHIEREEQFLESEKIIQQNGHLNFGLAHGILAPLIVLSNIKRISIYQNKQELDKAVYKLLTLYKIFSVWDNGILKYPTQLSYEDYLDGKISRISYNSGWCYGNLGILNGLSTIGNYLNLEAEYNFYNNEILKVINQDINKYNLDVPFLCHGYASVVIIQLNMYLKTKNTSFLKYFDRNVRKLLCENSNIWFKEAEHYYNDFSILEGNGGVILTLLSIIDENILFSDLLMI